MTAPNELLFCHCEESRESGTTKQSQLKSKIASLLSVDRNDIIFNARNAVACAVCFGATDKSVTVALVAAILSLLAVLVCVFAGVITFFINIHNRLWNKPAPV